MTIDPRSLTLIIEDDRKETGTNRELEHIHRGGKDAPEFDENRETGTNDDLPQAKEQQEKRQW